MASHAEKQERLDEIRQQVASGELIFRRMTAAERTRYPYKRPPAPEREMMTCEDCGQPHDPTPAKRAERPRRFCSRRCAALGTSNKRTA